jgi:hypothetical protein
MIRIVDQPAAATADPVAAANNGNSRRPEPLLADLADTLEQHLSRVAVSGL